MQCCGPDALDSVGEMGSSLSCSLPVSFPGAVSEETSQLESVAHYPCLERMS